MVLGNSKNDLRQPAAISDALQCRLACLNVRSRVGYYLQGRASTLHSQLPLALEQLAFLLLARPHLAQSVPYSIATKLAHERIAARVALDLLFCGPLVP